MLHLNKLFLKIIRRSQSSHLCEAQNKLLHLREITLHKNGTLHLCIFVVTLRYLVIKVYNEAKDVWLG